MPDLDQVLTTFPNRRFIINIKSQDPNEGKLLVDRLEKLSPDRQAQLMVYGDKAPVSIVRKRLPRIRTLWKQQFKQCFTEYADWSWSGYTPSRCSNMMLMLPSNYAPWLWGWPNRFLQRMQQVNTVVFIVGANNGESFSRGIDTIEQLEQLPKDYFGGIWTNRADLLGPVIRARSTK